MFGRKTKTKKIKRDNKESKNKKKVRLKVTKERR